MLVYVSPFRFLKLIHGFLIKFYLKCYILFISLTYNHFMDSNYVADVCMGPIFWIIENFTNTIGRLLVMGVVSLTSSVVLIAYWIGLPYWWNRNPFICVFLTVFGNWILLNVVFNYFMACLIAPGNPPEGELISEAVSICKKCIAPKPPRTHHCSVCNRCILKMDHHCPWLNNCVGYRNHRYFYFYMVYTVLGVFYLIIAGYDIGYNAIFGDLMEDEEFDGHSVKINKTGALIPVTDTVELNPSLRTFYESTKQQQSEIITHNDLRRKSLIYMALLNVGVFVALGFLVTWHGQLITNNETSVETHINKAESIRMKEINNDDDDGKLLLYINPYNLGAKKNWLQFLNLNSNRNFWIQILLPSIYQPPGNGLTWPTVRNNNNNKKELLLLARNNFKIEFKKCTNK